jgi:hypothetical protein
VLHWNYRILQADIYLDDVLIQMIYHFQENRPHTDKLFDRVVVDFEVNDPVLNHEMTKHQFRRDYYREKQYVHPMDRMLNRHTHKF